MVKAPLDCHLVLSVCENCCLVFTRDPGFLVGSEEGEQGCDRRGNEGLPCLVRKLRC